MIRSQQGPRSNDEPDSCTPPMRKRTRVTTAKDDPLDQHGVEQDIPLVAFPNPGVQEDFSFSSKNDNDTGNNGQDAAALRRRNAMYSKRKYYKKKGQIQILEATKLDLTVANERLKSENHLLESTLHDAQRKVLVLESMQSRILQSSSAPQFNAPPLFPTPIATSPPPSLPLEVSLFLDFASSSVAAASRSRAPQSTIAQSSTNSNAQIWSQPATPFPQLPSHPSAMCPSSTAATLAAADAETSNELETRIHTVRAGLLRLRQEEQQLMQLLERLNNSSPTQIPYSNYTTQLSTAQQSLPPAQSLPPHQLLLQEHLRILQEEQTRRAYHHQQQDAQKRG